MAPVLKTLKNREKKDMYKQSNERTHLSVKAEEYTVSCKRVQNIKHQKLENIQEKRWTKYMLKIEYRLNED